MFTVNGGLGCPQGPDWTPNGNTPCSGEPESCHHTQEQTCKQAIEVRNKTTDCKLGILTFKFTISSTDRNGFIDANDMQLARLIRIAKKGNYPPINTEKFDKC